MKLQLISLIFLEILVSCSVPGYIKQNDLVGLEVTHLSPILHRQGNEMVVEYDSMKTSIFSSKDQTVYFANFKIEDVQRNGRIILRDSNYVITTKKGSSPGWYYPNGQLSKSQLVNTDSFFQYKWYATIDLYKIFKESDYNLLHSEFKSDSLLLIEEYSLKGRGVDSFKSATMKLTFSTKVARTGYTLSKELDSLRNAKLIKAEIMNNPIDFKEHNLRLGAVNINYYLKEIPSNSPLFKLARDYYK